MAKLSAATRNALPDSAFAGPGRSYPVNDASHARNAKARASQAVNAGRMSKGEEAHIDARADRVTGKTQGGSRVDPQQDKRYGNASDRRTQRD